MEQFTLTINGQPFTVEAAADMPLLWVLRDKLQLTGTKYGCGIGSCGACMVQVDGKTVKSCVVPAISFKNQAITTIEGLSAQGQHVVQQAWAELQVPQCGYCQSGQIMTAAVLLATNPAPTDADIDAAMGAVLCRCGTYQRIRAGVHRAAELMAKEEQA